MIFTSLEFFLFFGAVLALRSFARGLTAETWLLLAASYLFYLASGPYAVALIAVMSVVDFHVARRIGSTEDPVVRRRWLFVSLASNLGVLGVFKYTNFFLDNLSAGFNAFGAQLSFPHADVFVPIGISYVTFAGMSYVLDVYHERLEACRRPSEYLLYIAYFPKLLAGPIVRAPDFLEQFRNRPRATVTDVEIGLAYFLLGAVKKLVIADQLAPHVGLIFDDPGRYDALTLLQGVIGYTVQIYCDFSGYTDMAIGCARVMGIRIPENFLMPYSSVNIAEFWRRWHVTLSNWFRDYVFVPLELAMRGMQSATVRVSVNVVVTMLLCGLWHGASWTFVFWGGLHGAALAVHRVWRAWRPLHGATAPRTFLFVRTLGSRVLTLAVVMVGWVFFRAESWGAALDYLRGVVTWQGGVSLGSPYILPLSTLVFVTHLVVGKDQSYAEGLPQLPGALRVAVYSVAVFMLGALVPAETVPFVYFQF